MIRRSAQSSGAKYPLETPCLHLKISSLSEVRSAENESMEGGRRRVFKRHAQDLNH